MGSSVKLSSHELVRALYGAVPKPLLGQAWMRQAAVAVILRPGGEGMELLLIQRASFEGDRWSGHMAFPGGKVDQGDRGPMWAAVREVREELGLALNLDTEHLGSLNRVLTLSPRSARPMWVEPHVFLLERDEVALEPGGEVASALWVPWGELMSGRSSSWRRVKGVPVRLGHYRCRGQQVWGLTFQMIEDLRERLAHRSGVGVHQRGRWRKRL